MVISAQPQESGSDPAPLVVTETGFEWLQDRIPDGMRSTILFMEQWQWLLLAVIAVAAWLIQKISSHIGGSILNSILARVGLKRRPP